MNGPKLLLLALGLAGCASGNALHVVRPATAVLTAPDRSKVELKFRVNMALAKPFEGNSNRRDELRQALRKKLGEVPGKLVSLDDHAPILLSGALEGECARPHDAACDDEHLALATERQTPRLETTCVDYSKGNPLRYDCVLLRRSVTMHILAKVRLADAEGKSYDLALRLSTTRRTSIHLPKEQATPDSEAPAIDEEQMFAQLIDDAAARLAIALAPHVETIDEPSFDCGVAENLCREGWQRLRSCRYVAAKQFFEKARAGLPKGKTLAAVLWGQALAEQLAGDFAGSERSLREARENDPEQEAFGDQLSKLPLEKASAERVRAQGLSEFDACKAD